MCGIVGYGSAQRTDTNVVANMLSLIEHRGPDGMGTFANENVALGNALLAIVDVGNGAQPKTVEHGGRCFTGVYNGEIYNHRALRRELESTGIRFKTRCDTEVAVAAYGVWGVDCFRRLDGQWALALWDGATLVLSRDPFGIKPLFFWAGNGDIVFASEVKALFAHPAVGRRPDHDAIAEYLLHGFTFAAGYTLPDRSFYEGVRPVPPGCWVTWRPGAEPQVERWFELPLTEDRRESRAELASELHQRVKQSVDACLMGDVAVGVALSGGLDSSIIAALAANGSLRSGPLMAQCIRYKGQETNEDANHASIVADALGKRRIELSFTELGEIDYLDDLDEMIRHFDEPHWEPKQLAMFRNYGELKRRGARVVLTGEGSDELFFGYFHKFPGFHSPVIESPSEFVDVWSRRLDVVTPLLRAGPARRLRPLMEEAVARYYRPAFEHGASPARAMQVWYLQTFLHWLLLDNDRCSMAHSIEGRFPYLNRDVVELALAIPKSVQVGQRLGEEKLLLREAFREELPEAICRRPKAPLPSPLPMAFHETIVRRAEEEIRGANSTVWDCLNKERIDALPAEFRRRAAIVTDTTSAAIAGEAMTRYTPLGEPWVVRTPQLFGLLTLLRWWRMNFG